MTSIQHIAMLHAVDDFSTKIQKFTQKQNEIDQGPRFIKAIRNFFNWDTKPLISLANDCQSLLDKLEKVPTVFTQYTAVTHIQNKSCAATLKTAQSIISLLSASKSNEAKDQLQALTLKVASLQYRIEGVNGGLDRSKVNPELTEKICAAALEWKNKNPLIENKTLSFEEVLKLQKASTYPEFTQVLLENRSLKESFFNWSLRDNNDVSLFVEFPATTARIKSAYLNSRIGKLGVKAFQNRMPVENSQLEETQKNIVLPFYNGVKTENISILDESREVQFNHGLRMTINKIFNVFSRKNHEVGCLEIFKHGIMNWNVQEVGPLNPVTGKYDSIDITADNWLDLFPVLQTVTKEELENRISDKLENGQWVVFAKASRSTADLDLDKRHGYFEMAVPREDGTYGIYPFGIFPPTFPDKVIELLAFLGNTYRAKLAFPDENFFYSHRQQAEHPIKLTADEARDFMKVLQMEFLKSRYGNLIFQFGAENCAYWSQKTVNTIEAKKHNYYKTDYVVSHPLNPLMKNIFAFFRSLPTCIRNNAIGKVDALFYSRRGVYVFENREKVFKSHKTSPVRNEFVIYQPGHLHHQILLGLLKGRVSLGSC